MRFLLSILSCIAFLVATPVRAGVVPIGTMATWAANPVQVNGDKTFTYLSDSGNWNGSEYLYLASNLALESHSLGMLTSAYAGPTTLSVSSKVDITSPSIFTSVALDQDHTGDNVDSYKDVFGSAADWEFYTTPGAGTLATMHATNNVAPGDVPLPPLQTIWVRDTISLDSTGSVLSVSNTYVQAVPEPGTYARAAVGIAVAAARRLRRRLFPS
jgi:hypothetical protein